MTTHIILDLDPECKPCADLICPQPTCRALCTFSSGVRQVTCPVCGWQHPLTDTEHDELLDAILGITTLDVPSYLLILATQDSPTPPPCEGVFLPQVSANTLWPTLAARPVEARP